MYSVLLVGAGNQSALADAPGSGKEGKCISFAHAVTKHDGFNLAGFYDIDGDKSLCAMQIWGGASYCCIEHAMGEIDIAVVATNDDAHYGPLLELVKYPHLKLVLCEKPLCDNLQQVEEIVRLYKEAGIPLAVGYHRNYNPYFAEMKRCYEEGDYGKLISYSVKYNRGLLHTATHAVALLDWLFGLDNLPGGLRLTEVKTDYRVWQIELYFERCHWREEIIGDQPVQGYYDNSSYYVMDNCYQFLQGNEPLRCSGEQALKALEVCYKLKGEPS